MDNSDEIKKKVDEFISKFQKEREQKESIEKEAGKVTKTKSEMFWEKERERMKSDLKWQMAREYESIKPFQEKSKPNTNEVIEEKDADKKDRGCLYLSLLLGVLIIILISWAGNWELGRSVSIAIGGVICLLLVMFVYVKVVGKPKE